MKSEYPLGLFYKEKRKENDGSILVFENGRSFETSFKVLEIISAAGELKLEIVGNNMAELLGDNKAHETKSLAIYYFDYEIYGQFYITKINSCLGSDRYDELQLISKIVPEGHNTDGQGPFCRIKNIREIIIDKYDMSGSFYNDGRLIRPFDRNGRSIY